MIDLFSGIGGSDLTDKAMCDLWGRVQELYACESQDVREALSERTGQAQRVEAAATRVDRLRALGNAVVPQIVAEIGLSILSAYK